jgi:hypothetical protein
MDEKVSELERENDILRHRLATMEQDLVCRSPTRKPKAKQNLFNTHDSSLDSSLGGRESDLENIFQKVNTLKLAEDYQSPSTTPKASAKKPRKLTARKRDLGPEEEL